MTNYNYPPELVAEAQQLTDKILKQLDSPTPKASIYNKCIESLSQIQEKSGKENKRLRNHICVARLLLIHASARFPNAPTDWGPMQEKFMNDTIDDIESIERVQENEPGAVPNIPELPGTDIIKSDD